MLIGVAVGVGVGVGGGSVFVISSSVRVGRISAVSVTLMVMDASMRVLVMFASMVLVGKSEVVKVRSCDMANKIIQITKQCTQALDRGSLCSHLCQ